MVLVMVMVLTFTGQDYTNAEYHREPKTPSVVIYATPLATLARTEELDA
jgi:hypothetical protein